MSHFLLTLRCSIVPNTSKSGGWSPTSPSRETDCRLTDSGAKSREEVRLWDSVSHSPDILSVILMDDPELAFNLTSLRRVRAARLFTLNGGETIVTWRFSNRGQQLIREVSTDPGTFGNWTVLSDWSLSATQSMSCHVWSRSFTKIIFLRSRLGDCV